MNKQKKTAGNHEMKDRKEDLQRNQNWKNTGKNLELKKLWKEPVNQCGCINKHYLAIIMKKKFHNVKKLTGDKSLDPVWSSFLAAL